MALASERVEHDGAAGGRKARIETANWCYWPALETRSLSAWGEGPIPLASPRL